MVVLSHSCLPLTSNLKKLEGAEDSEDGAQSFRVVCDLLIKAVRKGESPDSTLHWDYDYNSLWSSRLRLDKRKVNIWKCSKETFIRLLGTRTYWYKRLPLGSRLRVKALSRDSRGRRLLKDYLDTCDGVVTSLFLGFPELFRAEGYALSDRIINSVLCQCIHNFSRFQKKLKQVRKRIKKCALEKRVFDIPFDQLRDMSYMVRPIQILNEYAKRSSKEKMFRVAVVSQTRATGLAGRQQMEDTVTEFLHNVTTEKAFEPDELLSKCIDRVTTVLAKELNVGINAEFKISMSTSACRESGVSKEGKFGYLKTLVAKNLVQIPPLSKGEGGTLGNWLWPEALRRLKTNRDEVLSVNIAAIRENGKSRIVTSGSFWKDAALQPFSHITLNLIKTLDYLRDGLRAGRLGWKFISKVKYTPNDRDGFNWIFPGRRTQKSRFIYSSDWERATDIPSPKQAWAVTGSLLEKTGLDQDTLAAVKMYWLGPKPMYYRGKRVGTLINGIPMGDPLTKTNLSLAHPICDLYAVIKTAALVMGDGNGDDVIRIMDDPAYAIEHARASSMLGYNESPDDTAITQDWGNYCEEWFHIPVSAVNTTEWGSRFKEQMLLPYLDVPKIRIILATEKDREDFSSNPIGKVTLMGHDQEYFSKFSQGPARTIFAVASALQDISLATIDRKEPLFLPRQINGGGKPPPDWSHISWLNIIRRCRTWQAKYYVNVMREINNGEEGLSSFRGGQKESNHFKEEVLLETFEIPEDDWIKKCIFVRKHEWNAYPEGVLVKLVTLGYLVPESKLSKYYLFQERLEQLQQTQKDADLFECVKAEMIKFPDIDVHSQETEDIVKRFVDDYRDQPYRLRIGKTENLYSKEIITVLQSGDPLRVTNLKYSLLDKFGLKNLIPRNTYELKGRALYLWFCKARRSLLETGEIDEMPPTDIIEDDPIIVQTIMDGGSDIFIIATDDIKLLRLAMNKNPDTWVFRMSCIHYLQTNTWCAKQSIESYDDEITRIFRETYKSPSLTVSVLVDQGSVGAWVNKYAVDSEENTYFQTIGVPWRKDVKPSNLERKPCHGFLTMPKECSMKDLRFPLSLYDRETHRLIKRSLSHA